MPQPTTIELMAAVLFAIAVSHTFLTSFFEKLAHRHPKHAGVLHLMGEVEVVFGFWAMVLTAAMMLVKGSAATTQYIDSRNFTEPMFVFAIMVIAGSKPVLQVAMSWVQLMARAMPLLPPIARYMAIMTCVPLLGSFITEPAAMTLAALMLSRSFFCHPSISTRLKYATLGVLLVNISIGGTLTSFAAPPILMVANAWGWDTSFMLSTFGWKAAIAVATNTLGVGWVFRKELLQLAPSDQTEQTSTTCPIALTAVHLACLIGVVMFAHHPHVFMGIFLLFLGMSTAYGEHQDGLMLRESLLVAFFLSGLVVLGGLQQWWLQPLLMSMNTTTIFTSATLLTAITDNAALTYLGSLVHNLSDDFKYALVTGAVTGGGLTIIANAPNPAGIAIVRHHFEQGTVRPLPLFLAALLPTLVAAAAFNWL